MREENLDIRGHVNGTINIFEKEKRIRSVHWGSLNFALLHEHIQCAQLDRWVIIRVLHRTIVGRVVLLSLSLSLSLGLLRSFPSNLKIDPCIHLVHIRHALRNTFLCQNTSRTRYVLAYFF